MSNNLIFCNSISGTANQEDCLRIGLLENLAFAKRADKGSARSPSLTKTFLERATNLLLALWSPGSNTEWLVQSILPGT